MPQHASRFCTLVKTTISTAIPCHFGTRQNTAAKQRAIYHRIHALGHIAASLLMRKHSSQCHTSSLAHRHTEGLMPGRANALRRRCSA